MRSAFLWASIGLLIVFSPVLIVLSPLLLLLGGCMVLVNIGRATEWKLSRSRKLLALVVREVRDMLWIYIPTMTRVLFFYTTKTSRENIRCHIPYEEYYSSWLLKRCARLKRKQRATPPPTPPSPRSFTEPTTESAKDGVVSNTTSTSLNASISSDTGSTITDLGSSFASEGVESIPFPARGKSNLSTLDVYGVRESQLRPVVVFIYGGAWGSGRKWYYATVAHNVRSAARCCVVVPDYPTFPTGTVQDMVEALHAVIQWVNDHAVLHGGDPTRIILVGHSAGAHLIAMWSIRRAMALQAARTSSSGSSLVAEQLAKFAAQMHIRGDFRPPVSLFSLPCVNENRTKSAKTSEPFPSSPLRTVVDFTTGPSVDTVMLFAAPLDLLDHLEWERARCVEAVSTMRGATDGYWTAVSPTRMLRCWTEVMARYEAKEDPQVEKKKEEEENHRSVTAAPQCHLDRCDFPKKFLMFHDVDDKTVSIEQSRRFRDALLEATKTDKDDATAAALKENKTTIDVDSWCPPVVEFPHGHGGIVVDCMSLFTGAKHPFVLEVAQQVERLSIVADLR